MLERFTGGQVIALLYFLWLAGVVINRKGTRECRVRIHDNMRLHFEDVIETGLLAGDRYVDYFVQLVFG